MGSGKGCVRSSSQGKAVTSGAGSRGHGGLAGRRIPGFPGTMPCCRAEEGRQSVPPGHFDPAGSCSQATDEITEAQKFAHVQGDAAGGPGLRVSHARLVLVVLVLPMPPGRPGGFRPGAGALLQFPGPGSLGRPPLSRCRMKSTFLRSPSRQKPGTDSRV